jgi:hypothetical protein
VNAGGDLAPTRCAVVGFDVDDRLGARDGQDGRGDEGGQSDDAVSRSHWTGVEGVVTERRVTG